MAGGGYQGKLELTEDLLRVISAVSELGQARPAGRPRQPHRQLRSGDLQYLARLLPHHREWPQRQRHPRRQRGALVHRGEGPDEGRQDGLGQRTGAHQVRRSARHCLPRLPRGRRDEHADGKRLYLHAHPQRRPDASGRLCHRTGRGEAERGVSARHDQPRRAGRQGHGPARGARQGACGRGRGTRPPLRPSSPSRQQTDRQEDVRVPAAALEKL